MDDKLRICSLNVNGLRDYRKRSKIFTWLRMKNFDIIFLQETHCAKYSESKLWEKEWGGTSFWSFGGTRSRGTAIMVRDGLSYNKNLFYYDAVGRLVVLDITLHECCYRLINVYAPNNHAERIPWFNDLHRWFMGDKFIIFGGDFNCIENKNIDKVGGNVVYGDVGANILGTIRNNYHLVDAYRTCFPHDVATSWVSADGTVACRLDRFYVSASLKSHLAACMTPCAFSDHSAVEITLTIKNTLRKGPSYWKCNVHILSDPDFTADLEDLCNQCMQAESKDSQWWENCKICFKRLLILHGCRLAQNYRSSLSALETELRELQLKSLRDTASTREQIKIVKDNISDLLQKKFEGAKIRSRAKYLDTEETPSSFFLRVEKQNAAKSTISELSIDGKTVRETADILQACRSFYADLYSAEPVVQTDMRRILELVDGLSSSLTAWDGEITVEECVSAINGMENNKTPGSDGIPKEFYSKFFHLFGTGFVEMINNCFKAGLLPPSLRHGIITLACKDQANAQLLTNWRPISLLNVDYKILAKVLYHIAHDGIAHV